ncbi:hypothetical protein WMY93_008575 [Mugilogobius chulae]|uniref:RCC1-like domain-containing protein n=1 Tax=Mugilogobius chulae TaxID=88201 RepID=A0AAW0PQK3_9GOBI
MPAKRGAPKRKSEAIVEDTDVKKVKVSHRSHAKEMGLVLVLGQGDVGQLGLGEDIMERKKPALVTLPEQIVQVVAGGMHSVCLSESGHVYTFGCNDEGALGRDTSEEGSETVPGKVELEQKVVQVSAGDSHSAALTEEGVVYVWGSFRDNNGVIGLLEPFTTCTRPSKLPITEPVVKIASGNDHLVIGGRKGLSRLLEPQMVKLKGKIHFTDAFCGAYLTFAVSDEGYVYGFGLSNYHQLGTKSTKMCYVPVKLTCFKNSTTSWVGFAGGQHHTLCLDAEGQVYSLGRAEYGRLGLGREQKRRASPRLLPEWSQYVAWRVGLLLATPSLKKVVCIPGVWEQTCNLAQVRKMTSGVRQRQTVIAAFIRHDPKMVLVKTNQIILK